MTVSTRALCLSTLLTVCAMPAVAQTRPAVVSPDLDAGRRATFRIYAPQARAVTLRSPGDIPGLPRTPPPLTKDDRGVWTITVGPLDPGAYRYVLVVDEVATIDPVNPSISESLNNVWSLLYVAGSDFMDTKDVPHGSVASVTYRSKTLAQFRRMHVYTPPGYEAGREKYPVFYLLHGAGDNDEAWSSVGRAGFILDNLIAAKTAVPMIVVMPAGHTRREPPPGGTIGRVANDEFVGDFLGDVKPYVEAHYRALTDRSHTAIAGLSMGGGQTLNIFADHLDSYAYVGIFSSGLLRGWPGMLDPGGRPQPPADAPTAADWEHAHAATLDNASLKKGLKMLWLSTGKDDGLLSTTKATVDLLKQHGFAPAFTESPGGHTWINWRNYLREFVPQLFR